MKTLWERTPPRGQCGKGVVAGLKIGAVIGVALVAAALLGLV